MSPRTAWAAAIASASWALLLERRARRGCLLAALFAAAAGHAAGARDSALAPPLAAWLDRQPARDAAPIEVDGTLTEDASPGEAEVRLTMDVARVRHEAAWQPMTGRIHVFVAGQFGHDIVREWTAGRRIRAPVRLRPVPVLLNPGGPSARWQALTRRVVATGTIKSALLIEVARAPLWDEAAARVRAAVRRGVARWFAPYPPDVAAIVTAVLIGDRAGIDEAVEERLQRAGTYHVVAISGGNVALLTAAAYLALRLVVRSHRWRAAAALVLVVTYGWIVGGDPSVTRAVAAACLYLVSVMAGLALAPMTVVALVALAIAIADPLAVLNAGQWLTFGATLAIVLVAGRPPPHGETRRGVLGRAVRDVWRATIAAELALLPVGAALFARVSVAGLGLNFVAVPMMTVVQASAAVAVTSGGVLPMVGRTAASVAAVAAYAILESARLVDLVPWLSWRVPPPPLAIVLLFYLGGAGWLHATARIARRRAAAAAFLVAIVFIVSAPLTSCARPPDGWLRLTMFDVGQGEAMLLQVPGGLAFLIDAGGRTTRFDSGERILMPGVWASGERRLRALAFSHADLDHIGGAEAMTRQFGPAEIWEGVPVPPHRERAALVAAADERRSTWRTLQRGDGLRVGSVSLTVLHPPLADWERQRVRNDDSLVLRVRYGDVEMLLTGDVGAEVEQALDLADAAPLRVLKVGHHGSRSSTTRELVERYEPDVALISAGRGNPFGHPSADVLRRLEHAGARVYRTDRDGAIIVETDGHVVRVRPMRGPGRTVRVWPSGA